MSTSDFDRDYTGTPVLNSFSSPSSPTLRVPTRRLSILIARVLHHWDVIREQDFSNVSSIYTGVRM